MKRILKESGVKMALEGVERKVAKTLLDNQHCRAQGYYGPLDIQKYQQFEKKSLVI